MGFTGLVVPLVFIPFGCLSWSKDFLAKPYFENPVVVSDLQSVIIEVSSETVASE